MKRRVSFEGDGRRVTLFAGHAALGGQRGDNFGASLGPISIELG